MRYSRKNVRAFFGPFANKEGMTESEWQHRLRMEIVRALAKPGASEAGLSAQANLGKNFVGQFLKTGRIPSVENFVKLCVALGVSPSYILTGQPITPEIEFVMECWPKLPPKRRRALIDLLAENTTGEAQQ